jgi:hypothetical protein
MKFSPGFAALLAVGIVLTLVLWSVLVQRPTYIDWQNSPGDGSDGLPRMQLPSNSSLNASWLSAYHTGYYFQYYQNWGNRLVEANASQLIRSNHLDLSMYHSP